MSTSAEAIRRPGLGTSTGGLGSAGFTTGDLVGRVSLRFAAPIASQGHAPLSTARSTIRIRKAPSIAVRTVTQGSGLPAFSDNCAAMVAPVAVPSVQALGRFSARISLGGKAGGGGCRVAKPTIIPAGTLSPHMLAEPA